MTMILKVRNMVWDGDESDAETIKHLPTKFEMKLNEPIIRYLLNKMDDPHNFITEIIEDEYPWCNAGYHQYKFDIRKEEE